MMAGSGFNPKMNKNQQMDESMNDKLDRKD